MSGDERRQGAASGNAPGTCEEARTCPGSSEALG